MVAIGAGIGVALLIVNALLARTKTTFRAHVMPVAVGIYLPFSIAPPLLLGGIIRHLVTRSTGDGSEAHDRGVLLGSGLIAGEALMGIGLGALIAAEVALPQWASSQATSLLAFLAVAGVLWAVARRRTA
jgi:uncharacterized oligopeptide transporter (OPT) family protein